MIAQKPQRRLLYKFHDIVGVEGFEPSITGPKPAALPLGYTPISTSSIGVLTPKVNGAD